MVAHRRIAAGGVDFLDALGDQETEVVFLLDERRIRLDREAEKHPVGFVQEVDGLFEIAPFPGGLGLLVDAQGVFDRDHGVIRAQSVGARLPWPESFFSSTGMIVLSGTRILSTSGSRSGAFFAGTGAAWGGGWTTGLAFAQLNRGRQQAKTRW